MTIITISKDDHMQPIRILTKQVVQAIVQQGPLRFREVMLPRDPQVVPRVGYWSAFRISIPPLASFPLSHQALSSIVRIQVLHPDTLWPKSPG